MYRRFYDAAATSVAGQRLILNLPEGPFTGADHQPANVKRHGSTVDSVDGTSDAGLCDVECQR